MRRTFVALLILLLVNLAALSFKVQPAKAIGTIYIRADGSIDPPTAPLSTVDNVTYTFIGDIDEPIVVMRNNIVINGNGYALEGPGSSGIGMQLVGVNNVTVKNLTIFTFEYAVYVFGCSEITVVDNWMAGNSYGVYLQSSSGSTISSNSFWSDFYGIVLISSSNNNLSSNNGGGPMQGGGGSIHLMGATNNVLSGNNIPVGSIILDGSNNNTLHSNHVSYGSNADIILNNSNWNNLTGNFAGGPGDSIALSYSSYNTLSKNILGTGMGVCISLYSSSFNVLLGNTASGYYTNYGFNGINLNSSQNNVLLCNNVTDYWDGIYLVSSPGNTISGNTLSGNSNAGIEIVSSSNVTVLGNNLANNSYDGIYLESSSNASIIGNIITNNTYNGIHLLDASGNKLLNNTIENNGGAISGFFSDSSIISNNRIRNNNGGIYYTESSGGEIIGNTIEENGQGVVLFASSWTSVSRNEIIGNNGSGISLTWGSLNSTSDNIIVANNGPGIGSFQSSFGMIIGNFIQSNRLAGICFADRDDFGCIEENSIINHDYGFFLHMTLGENISRNYIAVNDIGLRMVGSAKVYHNTFFSNNLHVEIFEGLSSNTWDDGYPSGGNYWDYGYNGTDFYSGPNQNQPGSDGIGDISYNVGVNASDRYPLMKPYKGHNIAVLDVIINRTMIPCGAIQKIAVEVVNTGSFPEMFSVTTSANGTPIQSLAVSLDAEGSTFLTFYWETSSVDLGNYTMMAYVSPVFDENDESDNTLIYSVEICVTIPGNVDGDSDIDIFDIVAIAGAYGSEEGDLTYNPNYDIDGDGDIDIFDIVAAASHYGERW